MNLRDLKKDIEYVVGSFLDDCYVAVTFNPKTDEDKVAGLIAEGVALYDSLRDKVNAKDGAAKAHFAALRKELLEKTDELYSKLSDLVKEAK